MFGCQPKSRLKAWLFDECLEEGMRVIFEVAEVGEKHVFLSVESKTLLFEYISPIGVVEPRMTFYPHR